MVRLILAVHILLGEVAALILEIRAVHGKYFRENTSFDLLLKLIHTIAVDERASPRSMSMQIQKCKEPIVAVQMHDPTLDCVDRWLKFYCWVQIAPVQIYSVCINPVMASSNSVRIEDWKNVKHKIVSKQACFLMVLYYLLNDAV